ncbi:MAG: hypothetical protein HGA47_01920 [Zoogloea sp.]|nr:hypothetical protein [Zoogloea sp.]
MIINANKESTQFINSLKQAGIAISNEREVLERLGEAREWRYAFTTLAREGKRIGIWFAATAKTSSNQLHHLFSSYRLSGDATAAFEASLQR